MSVVQLGPHMNGVIFHLEPIVTWRHGRLITRLICHRLDDVMARYQQHLQPPFFFLKIMSLTRKSHRGDFVN